MRLSLPLSLTVVLVIAATMAGKPTYSLIGGWFAVLPCLRWCPHEVKKTRMYALMGMLTPPPAWMHHHQVTLSCQRKLPTFSFYTLLFHPHLHLCHPLDRSNNIIPQSFHKRPAT
ncbi:hypothetical protein KCP76_22730 [Salmonella enterica subsp. enterica serovar Weltevreden]|nr:hypothetical protein KCP76_22730 [Salmonella enterica subsp. enterica serovar Weltevreden]